MENLTQIEIFRNFPRNRNFSEILTKTKFFENLTTIEIFRKFDQNRKF